MNNIRVFFLAVICFLATRKVVNGGIGMTWGRMSVQRLLPSIVVDLLLQNEIKHCRIYTGQADIVEAFAGSGINLTITLFNVFTVKNDEEAEAYVHKKIIPYNESVNISRVYVSNYVLHYAANNQTIRDAAIREMALMQKALNKAGLGNNIKATMTHSYLILKQNITRPSEAEFKDDVIEDVTKIIDVLKKNNAPFVIGLFPQRFVLDNKMDPDFAFADNRSSQVITDVDGAVYTNAFDFMYDAFIWALEKAGGGGLKVVVDHLGWPTDGYPSADSATAERFFKTMIPKLVNNVGTPKLPGEPIEAFVHSLVDESMFPAFEPWGRHMGVYRSNGEPKYKIDLTGRGRDMYPPTAKGIMRMPDRWCVFNGSLADGPKVEMQVGVSCNKSDCTSVEPGGSCSRLTYEQTVSYKYNMFFQTMFQDEKACDFDGLGKVVTDDPSVGGCVFPVEVVKGEQVGFFGSDGIRTMNRWGVSMLTVTVLVALFGVILLI